MKLIRCFIVFVVVSFILGVGSAFNGTTENVDNVNAKEVSTKDVDKKEAENTQSTNSVEKEKITPVTEEEKTFDNQKQIEKEYQDYISGSYQVKTRQLDNGIYVIDVGYRNVQPVALIEKQNKDFKEYIIAINYKIQDNKMDWGYGYYYQNNLSKARADFDKVLSGGNLVNTFDKKEREER